MPSASIICHVSGLDDYHDSISQRYGTTSNGAYLHGWCSSSWLGVIGAVNIPIINRSVIWWESQHQKASITLGGSSIDQAYLVPLFVAVAGFSLLFGALVLMRMRTALAEMRIEARMRRMADD